MRILLGFITLLVSIHVAQSSELNYTPVNPSFGGNPLNSTHLLNLANAQKTATATDANSNSGSAYSSSTDGDTSAELFVRQLEGRLLSALASQVTEAIFGENPQESGTITFGETEITFEQGTGSIILTITDFTDGTVTNIEVPQLQTN
ncbi:curli production assembly/transport component CsgF [Cohaesibacter sp. ES.047]|uniref:curli assembly protein CsgF n=1 Tax=Cohaesibacter sp. ES.047 TaxID=1798205 RepID=UPI000BBFE4A5|nr:curli assembly protein CsgF [Cohaesibacter sp. ES.047]SNY93688.1 curli production assembly/transport component CsgF [Cohaesibacter sp. ES.047]